MATPDLLFDLAELDSLIEHSRQRPVFLLKHSLTCPISAAAHRAYLRFVEEHGEEQVRFALIEIQKARPLSNAVAERSGIRHESPQAILFKDGEPVWNASHWSITEQNLAGALAGAQGG